MARQIYRQAALDRLSSPEQLDRPHAIVGSRGWLSLLALTAVMFGGLVWALLSEAPVKVAARGIVLQQGGLFEISADAAGRINTLHLKPGATIKSGETVAEFQRTGIAREVRRAEAELKDARARFERLTDFYQTQDKRRTIAAEERIAGIKTTLALVQRREALLSKRITSISRLVTNKVMLQSRLIDAELEVANARERLARLNDEAAALRLRMIDRRNTQRLTLLDEKLKVERAARKLQRLNETFAEEQFIASSHSGRVVEVKVSKGDVVAAGAAIATLAPLDSVAADPIGVLYVTPTDGKRIMPGMEVELVPSTYRREEFGYIKGQVSFVSPIPATAEGMQSILRNSQLVTQLSGGAAPFEVRVRFVRDKNSASGLAWSSSSGPNAQVNPGTFLDALIKVEHVPIANLAVPGLAESIGIRSNE